MVRKVSSSSVLPATVAPCRRISTIQWDPSARASEAPSSGLATIRLVSPNSSRLSQTGALSPVAEHDPMGPKRTRQRGAFLRLGHDQAGLAEFVAAVPERRLLADGGAAMIDRLELGAGNAEWQDRRRVMVTHRVYFRPRFVDFAMDDALAIEPHLDRLHDLRIECEFEDVFRLHQFWAARIRHQIASRIGGMAQGDVTEGVEHAFVGDHAVGARQLLARLVKFVQHRRFPQVLRHARLYAGHPRLCLMKARRGWPGQAPVGRA